jgi:hypothetical protein
MSSWLDGWPSSAPQNFNWASLLILLIFQSLLAALLPYYLKRLESRSHHRVKAVNEILASHQVVYFAFFFAILEQVKVDAAEEWSINALVTLLVISVLCFVFTIVKARNQNRVIKGTHTCKGKCKFQLTRSMKWRIFGWSVVRALILLTIALFLAFHPRFSH